MAVLTLTQALCMLAAAAMVGATTSKDPTVCSFGPFIEGAAVDKIGGVFAVNANSARNSFGSLSSCGTPTTSVADKQGTELNSLRLLPTGEALSTDTQNARVVLVSADGKSKTYCDGGGLVRPNDLALSRAGWLYISGQRWTDQTVVGDGGVWLCKGPGKAQQLWLTGRTNGIELSPDDKFLFVSQAFNKAGKPVSNRIIRFTLKQDGTLGEQTTFHDFAADGSAHIDVDGMRADTAGNLFVTRHEGAAVVQLSPAGKVLQTLQTPFWAPTNLELAGVDGKDLFVVGRCGFGTPFGVGAGCLVSFKGQAFPGRTWSMLQQGQPKLPTSG